MKEYLMGLFVLSLCCATVELLAPGGEGGGIARHIKLMSALCLLCVLAEPLIGLCREGASFPERLYGWVEDQMSESKQSEQQLEERWQEENRRIDLALAADTVTDMLSQEFKLAAGECRATLVLDSEGDLCEVRVGLSGRGIWSNTGQMQAYIKDTFGCESVIYIE